jgi:Ser/Thr protein kinase RdoA (MazF antagonist)
MFLTEANVLHYLAGRGFTGFEPVVDGTFAVYNLSRRNRNFRVSCGTREYLVKQARKWDVAGRSSLEREADFCRQAKTDPRFLPLRRLTPESYSYDPDHSILIFEFLPDESPLPVAPNRLAPEAGRLVGAAMARFHGDMCRSEFAELYPQDPPVFLRMHRWDAGRLTEQPGQQELVRLVKRHGGFATALEAIEREWHPETMIHGDWKLDNCLVSGHSDRIHVVDWELAGWGDPMWDVATLLQSYWNLWLDDSEEHPIATIRPVLRAFLEGYGAAMGRVTPELRARAIRLAAARMLQTAWESLQKAHGISGLAVRLAQASLNILTRPEWAAGELLGTHD